MSNGTPPTFATARELRDRTPEEPDWIWRDYIATGSLVLLAGRPKAGKSTIAVALSEAIVSNAGTFLGRDLVAGGVVYCSEEGAATLRHKLPDSDRLHVLTRDSAWPKPSWPQLVGHAAKHANDVQARLLVIDTAAYWMSLAAELENDAGAVQAAMMPLAAATRTGLAVLISTHSRKSGGEHGDAVRGSNAWTGSVDTIIELERGDEGAPPTRRLLLGLGRYPSTPACTLIDHDPMSRSWSVAGQADDRRSARSAGLRDRVLDALAEGALGRSELEKATGIAWRDLLSVINDLVTERSVVRTGEGRKGSPYRFVLPAVGSTVPQDPTAPTECIPVSVVVPKEPQKQDAVAPTASDAYAAAAEDMAEVGRWLSERRATRERRATPLDVEREATADEEQAYERALSLIEGGQAT